MATVLRGASTAGIRQAGHDRLSTHGLLGKNSLAEVRGWIDQLIGLEHLCVSGDRYPTLYLSSNGVEVMTGKRDVTLYAIPRKPARRKPAQAAGEPDGPPVDEALFESLRTLRRELARERGVPPYLIFNDRTLTAMAAHKPRGTTELLAIKGVGEKKAADLGPAFLERIARHASEIPQVR